MEQKERRENGKGNGKESTSRNGYERERNGKDQKEKEYNWFENGKEPNRKERLR